MSCRQQLMARTFCRVTLASTTQVARTTSLLRSSVCLTFARSEISSFVRATTLDARVIWCKAWGIPFGGCGPLDCSSQAYLPMILLYRFRPTAGAVSGLANRERAWSSLGGCCNASTTIFCTSIRALKTQKKERSERKLQLALGCKRKLALGFPKRGATRTPEQLLERAGSAKAAGGWLGALPPAALS